MELELDRSRVAWGVIGAVLAATLVYVLHSFVGTFVFGLFIYYATRPVYRRTRRRIPSRSLAAAVALTVVVLPILLLLGYTIGIALQEFNRLEETVDLGPFEQALQPYVGLSEVVNQPETLLNDPDVQAVARDLSDTVLDSLGLVGTGLLHLFVMLAIAFYLLRDGPRLSRWFHRRFDDADGVLDAFVTAVDRDLYRVFSGNIYNALFTGTLGALSYSLLDMVAPASAGVPYPALVGLLAGAASLVPVVGMKLVYVPVTLYLYGVQYLSAEPVYWVPTAFVLLSFVVVDTIPDLVVRPMVSGQRPQVDYSLSPPSVRIRLSGEGSLHIGLIMFAYIFGPLLFGWYGLFLGPMLLVVMVHFARLVLPELLDGERIQPYAVDPSQVTGTGLPSGVEPGVRDASSPGDDPKPDAESGG
ncbi:AI-2E family transporter [Salinirubellus sp. GCM10025818]|uniref:AI-2E family transporter n=1 Tax=Salinirubellus TaxID=2162630 RepID=UPI0030D1E7C8